MNATLRLSRPFRLADAAWPYRIVLDGRPAGRITAGKRSSLRVAPGSHTLQVRSLHVVNRWLGFASPTLAFEVSDGESADFVCLVRSFVPAVFWWFACVAGDRSRWIVLDHAGPSVG